jgi:hypothetical protein
MSPGIHECLITGSIRTADLLCNANTALQDRGAVFDREWRPSRDCYRCGTPSLATRRLRQEAIIHMNSRFLFDTLSSAAAATALTGLVLWLLKSVIKERLKASVQFEFDQKLQRVESELTRLAEDRTRKIEKLLHHYERQVEEFYGPLWNMVHQIYVCNETKDKLVRQLTADQRAAVQEYYQGTYFRPFHDEMREIIKTKLYLVDGPDMPDSFFQYLRHASQERDQQELAKNYHIDTSSVRGVPWPQEFHEDIERGFRAAMKHYDECLDGLKQQLKISG